MTCPECGKEMLLRKGKFGDFYGCKGYPECRVTSALHPDGTQMSTPASPETKALRIKAHKLAEVLWGKWDSKFCKKGEMYDWLAHNTKTGHIGKMEKGELLETIEKLNTFIAFKDVK